MNITAHIDKEKPHVIRSESGAVIAVLVDYPLCRDSIGRLIVDAINNSNNLHHPRETTKNQANNAIDSNALLDAIKADAETWGNALNECGWKFIGDYQELIGEPCNALLFNNCKGLIRKTILNYIENVEKNITLTEEKVMELKADVRVWDITGKSTDFTVGITSDDIKELAEKKALNEIKGVSASTITIDIINTIS